MGYINQGLGPLPGGLGFEHGDAVFGYYIRTDGAGIGDDAAGCNGGLDARYELTVLAFDGGTHAEESLSSLRPI